MVRHSLCRAVSGQGATARSCRFRSRVSAVCTRRARPSSGARGGLARNFGGAGLPSPSAEAPGGVKRGRQARAPRAAKQSSGRRRTSGASHSGTRLMGTGGCERRALRQECSAKIGGATWRASILLTTGSVEDARRLEGVSERSPRCAPADPHRARAADEVPRARLLPRAAPRLLGRSGERQRELRVVPCPGRAKRATWRRGRLRALRRNVMLG